MEKENMSKDYLRSLFETLLELLKTSNKETVIKHLERMIEELK